MTTYSTNYSVTYVRPQQQPEPRLVDAGTIALGVGAGAALLVSVIGAVLLAVVL